MESAFLITCVSYGTRKIIIKQDQIQSVMRTLRFRIVVTWVCLVVIGVSWLFGFAHPLLAAACCLIVSTARSFVRPAFPRAPRWFERLVYVLLLPAIFLFYLGVGLSFGEPWAQIARVVLWICIPLLVAFGVYQDAKAWKLERPNGVVS